MELHHSEGDVRELTSSTRSKTFSSHRKQGLQQRPTAEKCLPGSARIQPSSMWHSSCQRRGAEAAALPCRAHLQPYDDFPDPKENIRSELIGVLRAFKNDEAAKVRRAVARNLEQARPGSLRSPRPEKLDRKRCHCGENRHAFVARYARRSRSRLQHSRGRRSSLHRFPLAERIGRAREAVNGGNHRPPSQMLSSPGGPR